MEQPHGSPRERVVRCPTPDFEAVPFPKRPHMPYREVVHDPITVWFRVEGAVPVTAYVDPTGGGQLEGAPPPVEVGTGQPGQREDTGGGGRWG